MGILFKREELFRQVWAKPLGPLSRRLGITSAKLREVCGDLEIPLPAIGHWSSVRAGKPVMIPELPAYDGPNELRIGTEKSAVQEAKLNATAVKNKGNSNSQMEAPVPKSPPRQPKFQTVTEWAEVRFSTVPHKNTLLRWVHEGRIQPQPQKIGRRWYVTPNAEYRPD